MSDDVTVIQADREAAADAVLAIRGQKDGDWQSRIRKGECDDGTMCQAFAKHRKAGEVGRDRVAKRIAELIAEGDGAWSPCSGCQEGVDGHVSETDYPYDPAFQCQPGGGCGECGGIGVIWHDRQYFASWEGFTPSPSTPSPDSGERMREAIKAAIRKSLFINENGDPDDPAEYDVFIDGYDAATTAVLAALQESAR